MIILSKTPLSTAQLENHISEEHDPLSVNYSHTVPATDTCKAYMVFDMVDEDEESYEIHVVESDAEPNVEGCLFEYSFDFM